MMFIRHLLHRAPSSDHNIDSAKQMAGPLADKLDELSNKLDQVNIRDSSDSLNRDEIVRDFTERKKEYQQLRNFAHGFKRNDRNFRKARSSGADTTVWELKTTVKQKYTQSLSQFMNAQKSSLIDALEVAELTINPDKMHVVTQKVKTLHSLLLHGTKADYLDEQIKAAEGRIALFLRIVNAHKEFTRTASDSDLEKKFTKLDRLPMALTKFISADLLRLSTLNGAQKAERADRLSEAQRVVEHVHLLRETSTALKSYKGEIEKNSIAQPDRVMRLIRRLEKKEEDSNVEPSVRLSPNFLSQIYRLADEQPNKGLKDIDWELEVFKKNGVILEADSATLARRHSLERNVKIGAAINRGDYETSEKFAAPRAADAPESSHRGGHGESGISEESAIDKESSADKKSDLPGGSNSGDHDKLRASEPVAVPKDDGVNQRFYGTYGSQFDKVCILSSDDEY